MKLKRGYKRYILMLFTVFVIGLFAFMAVPGGATYFDGNFTNVIVRGMAHYLGASPIVLEGDTTNDYQTTVAVTDPTADRTFTLPNYSGAAMLSALTTNAPDVANSVWGSSNGLTYEGATANDYETTITPTDPTADRTITIPNDSGTIALATGADDAATAVWFEDNTITAEGATANDHETSIAFTDPTADRTVTVPDADVNLANVGIFTIALSVNGQETTTLDPAAMFQMPFAATLLEVSVAARDIDTSDGNEEYSVDIEEAGTTVLSAAISITADATAVVGTVSDSAIADNAAIEVVLTLGGTTPAIDDLTVLLTFQK